MEDEGEAVDVVQPSPKKHKPAPDAKESGKDATDANVPAPDVTGSCAAH